MRKLQDGLRAEGLSVGNSSMLPSSVGVEDIATGEAHDSRDIVKYRYVAAVL
jgi:hypothetical protein